MVPVTNKYINFTNPETLSNYFIFPLEISSIIHKPKPFLASGPDIIQKKIPKTYNQILIHLTYICNTCSKIHHNPVEWKQAIDIPIRIPIRIPFKSSNGVDSYWLISVIDIYAKILETLIFKILNRHLTNNITRTIRFSEKNSVPNYRHHQNNIQLKYTYNNGIIGSAKSVRYHLESQTDIQIILFFELPSSFN